jgi:hypothetical protein
MDPIAEPRQAQAAATPNERPAPGPTPLDPRDLARVSGGLPRGGGWNVPVSELALPRGGGW